MVEISIRNIFLQKQTITKINLGFRPLFIITDLNQTANQKENQNISAEPFRIQTSQMVVGIELY